MTFNKVGINNAYQKIINSELIISGNRPWVNIHVDVYWIIKSAGKVGGKYIKLCLIVKQKYVSLGWKEIPSDPYTYARMNILIWV